MLENNVVSNGLVNYTGVLVPANQIVFVSRVPTCLESADIYTYIYIYIVFMYNPGICTEGRP